MERSETISALAKALSAAQGAIRNASKDADNPFFKSKYADLAAIRDAIREPFQANGLSCPQFISTRDGGRVESVGDKGESVVDFLTLVTVETVLLHESGEYMSSVMELPVWNADPQKIGSASTYGRRYALQSVAGVAAEVDDDGNASSGPRNEPRRTPPPATRQQQAAQQQRDATPARQPEPPKPTVTPQPTKPSGTITTEQRAKMKGLMEQLGIVNKVGANQIMHELTGLNTDTLSTYEQAHDLLVKLGKRVVEKGQTNV